MGSLAQDTELAVLDTRDGSPVRFRAELSRAWEIWGPAGGYLAAIALRAAGAVTPFPRVASLYCQFLAVASFDSVDIEVRTLRSGRTAAALSVTLTQGQRRVLEASTWVVADGLDGLSHDVAPLPPVPHPDRLQPRGATPYRFWDNLEVRQFGATNTIEQWRDREPGEPVYDGWFRFVPDASFDDPWLEAGRLVTLLDVAPWGAAAAAYREADLRFVAPSLDVHVQFHRPADRAEWLFCRARSDVADDGLVAGSARVWAEDGRLLASAKQHMLCAPVPR